MLQKLFPNLPSLKEVNEVFSNLPDEKRLRLVLEIMSQAEKLGQSRTDLAIVRDIVKEIANTPEGKLQEVTEILKRVERLAKTLPLSDIMKELGSMKT